MNKSFSYLSSHSSRRIEKTVTLPFFLHLAIAQKVRVKQLMIASTGFTIKHNLIILINGIGEILGKYNILLANYTQAYSFRKIV